METHNKINFGGYEVIAKERGYKVTDKGELLNPKGKPVGSFSGSGYQRLGLKIEGKNRFVHTHRLQAYQKYGDVIYSKGIVVRHLDGDKTNNSLDNIAIGTNRDNVMDRPKEQRLASAIKATKETIKYNPEEVIAFYNSNGKSYKKTKERFNISSSGTLHYILNKRKIVNGEHTATS